ncbi:putative DNA binding domain-containing protein [Actinoplanes sp. LDG1-06]|uniref:DNA binding domain-containing protein n=1 Tax=Paractinoplanes ovalisporus TaxID=2810368 RepID=A0ABS2AUQ5_9ACTN|nr:ATP-binding protein [Actinoplanes ovalisporus]MBM2623470.1 putative DNA binding domain-containing protein [Actinoplanes ovalisporus]
MPSNQVDAALAAAPAAVGKLLLDAPEDQWFDRKAASIQPKKLAEALVAFANAEGGTVVVGLNRPEVQGLNRVHGKINDLRQTPIALTSPPVRAAFEEVPCVNSAGENDILLVIRIEPGERVHETSSGECFLRVGDESHRLTYIQRRELEFDKGQAQFDGFPADGVSFTEIDAALVEAYQRRIGVNSGSVVDVFNARSLLTLKGQITNAGYLLFGKSPQVLFPQAYIRIIRFLGVERGTGARLGVEEGTDIRIEGSLPWAVQRASAEIERLIPQRRSLSSSGQFEATPIVPRDAWLEGLVNAVIHRSYSLSGDHIRVEIYPNRIEIESPGRFPGLANPNKPLEISRFARNPRIARVCADLRIGLELGEGIKRIFEEMRRVGLEDPVYVQTQGSVRLTLADIPRLDPRIEARLPHGSHRILDLLRAASNPLSTGDVAAALGMSRPWTILRLRALQDEGLLTWNGKSARDPRAVWALKE